MKKNAWLTAITLLVTAAFSPTASAAVNFASTASKNEVKAEEPKVVEEDAVPVVESIESEETPATVYDEMDEIKAPEPVEPEIVKKSVPVAAKTSALSKSALVSSKPAPTPMGGMIEGTVLAADTKSASPWISVKPEKGKEMTIQMDKSAKVSKGSKQATWTDLKAGVEVKVDYFPKDYQLIAKSVDIS